MTQTVISPEEFARAPELVLSELRAGRDVMVEGPDGTRTIMFGEPLDVGDDPEAATLGEKLWERGWRFAAARMILECLRMLGADHALTAPSRLVAEREDALSALRDLCARFGDNDWGSDLYLADVIEKHLARHLHERFDEEDGG